MTKIKLCGLSRPCDIIAVNRLQPDFIGFVFAQKSKRYVSPCRAGELKAMLDPQIQSVGVFVNEPVENVVSLLEAGTIDVAQLHGSEDEAYIAALRSRTEKTIIKAFRVDTDADVAAANACSADYVLLDSGNGGTGTVFDWQLLQGIRRPYFLAGGLNPENAEDAVAALKPYAVDVSSGIETDKLKDETKMAAFVAAVKRGDTK